MVSSYQAVSDYTRLQVPKKHFSISQMLVTPAGDKRHTRILIYRQLEQNFEKVISFILFIKTF